MDEQIDMTKPVTRDDLLRVVAYFGYHDEGVLVRQLMSAWIEEDKQAGESEPNK